MSIHQHLLTFRRSVALDNISASWKSLDDAGVLVGRLLAAHGATGHHWHIKPVSSICLEKNAAVASFQHYCLRISLILLRLLDTNLENEDLWLANEAHALVSFELFYDLLCMDRPIIGVDLVIVSVAQENQQEAVHVRVVFFCR